MKAMRKDMAGVSPVIAVILMVAITVVLAGVVFLWAQSFTEDAGGGAKTLSVDMEIQRDMVANDGSGDLIITPLKGDIDWNDYELYVAGASVTVTGLTTNVGEDETIALVAATGLAVGTEYNIRIVFIEDQTVVVNTNVVCKAA